MKPKTLRDEYAMTVLPSLVEGVMQELGGNSIFKVDGEVVEPETFIVLNALRIANAMMAEREKTNATD